MFSFKYLSFISLLTDFFDYTTYEHIHMYTQPINTTCGRCRWTHLLRSDFLFKWIWFCLTKGRNATELTGLWNNKKIPETICCNAIPTHTQKTCMCTSLCIWRRRKEGHSQLKWIFKVGFSFFLRNNANFTTQLE